MIRFFLSFFISLFFFRAIFFIVSVDNINLTTLINEDFDNLNNWKSIKLPLAKNPTIYSIIKEGANNFLKCVSENGASSLQHKEIFDVYQYPYVSWRWKIENILEKGDVTKKGGDDYPIRVYINFVIDLEKASPVLKFKYDFVKKNYGLEIPQYSLNYIIESKKQSKKIYDNPFDPENSKIIILRSGKEDTNRWFTEEINIVNDFKEAFGFPPPKMAYLAIMADTDNTKEKVISYIDYIKVYKKGEP